MFPSGYVNTHSFPATTADMAAASATLQQQYQRWAQISTHPTSGSDVSSATFQPQQQQQFPQHPGTRLVPY
jgi:hypothetical protein